MIWRGLASGYCSHKSANIPPTCGAAILVPLTDIFLLSSHDEYMSTPGAAMSISAPLNDPSICLFEKSAMLSLLSIAPTARMEGQFAGLATGWSRPFLDRKSTRLHSSHE